MLVNKNPLVLVGRPGLPANNLKDLIALMKTQRLREALPGFGTTGHLTSALFIQEAKVQLDFIPYRGAAPAMNDLLGDHGTKAFPEILRTSRPQNRFNRHARPRGRALAERRIR